MDVRNASLSPFESVPIAPNYPTNEVNGGIRIEE
jgi:hypothetical protein